MYESHYQFREKPFSLIPDPDFLYPSKGHKLAFNLLEYGFGEQTGFVVITGEVGSGKTTLVQRLLKTIPNDVVVGFVTNTHPSFGELLQWIALAFELDCEGKDKAALYQMFVRFLIDNYASNRRTVVIVDEAQNLALGALEELRMLSNVNAGKDYVLQLILVGQPQLLKKLRKPQLSQFAQRVGINYHLEPLDLRDTIAYIRHRLKCAGGNPMLFDEFACAAAYFYARGVPRLINVLCDLALVYGYAEDLRQINIDTVIDVVSAGAGSSLGTFRSTPQRANRREIKDMIRRAVVRSAGEPTTRYRLRSNLRISAPEISDN
jgi:type II secretory pathway predicted ATPase ExeA